MIHLGTGPSSEGLPRCRAAADRAKAHGSANMLGKLKGSPGNKVFSEVSPCCSAMSTTWFLSSGCCSTMSCRQRPEMMDASGQSISWAQPTSMGRPPLVSTALVTAACRETSRPAGSGRKSGSAKHRPKPVPTVNLPCNNFWGTRQGQTRAHPGWEEGLICVCACSMTKARQSARNSFGANMEKTGAAKGRQACQWPPSIQRAAMVGNRVDNVTLRLLNLGNALDVPCAAHRRPCPAHRAPDPSLPPQLTSYTFSPHHT